MSILLTTDAIKLLPGVDLCGPRFSSVFECKPRNRGLTTIWHRLSLSPPMRDALHRRARLADDVRAGGDSLRGCEMPAPTVSDCRSGWYEKSRARSAGSMAWPGRSRSRKRTLGGLPDPRGPVMRPMWLSPPEMDPLRAGRHGNDSTGADLLPRR